MPHTAQPLGVLPTHPAAPQHMPPNQKASVERSPGPTTRMAEPASTRRPEPDQIPADYQITGQQVLSNLGTTEITRHDILKTSYGNHRSALGGLTMANHLDMFQIAHKQPDVKLVLQALKQYAAHHPEYECLDTAITALATKLKSSELKTLNDILDVYRGFNTSKQFACAS